MKVKEILTRKPLWIGPGTTLMKAALGMKVMGVGMLPVCDDNRLIGTVTDRDITIRATAEGLDPKATPVSAVMSMDAIWCFEDQDLEMAAEMMEKSQVRRLPVLDQENHLVGIVSVGDLAMHIHADSVAARVLARISEPACVALA